MRKLVALLSIILVMVVCVAGCGGETKKEDQAKPSEQPQQGNQQQEVITLKYAHSFPVGHNSYKSAENYIRLAEQYSNGKLKIEHYPAEQLGKLKDMLNICSQGITDIAYVPPSFFAGQLPLSTVMILPFWTTATEGTEIFNRLVEECPEIIKEYDKYGVRPLSITCTSQYDVGTVKKPVRSPEDLKGLRLKTSGGMFDKIAVRYGIKPVTVASPEVYEATQRGITEGNIFSYASIKGYRVNELEKYHTLGLRMGGYPTAYSINAKKWESLPKDIQEALQRAADENEKDHATKWDAETEELAAQFEKEGMTIYRIKSEDRAKWEAPLKGIEEEWVQEMEKKGLPGKKVCEAFLKICKEVAK